MTIRILIAILLLAPAAWAETKTITGAADIDDAMMRSNLPDNNYGGRNEVTAFYQAFFYRSLVRVKNVSTWLGPNATITAAGCSLYSNYQNNTTLYFYQVFKPWVEGDENGTNDDDGDVTWNDWASDASEWGIAGCDSMDDSGSDNSGDGDQEDRKESAFDTLLITAINTWYVVDIPTALAQGRYDGTINEEGMVFLLTGSNDGAGFNSMEAASNKPRYFYTYTATGVSFEHSPDTFSLGTNWTTPNNGRYDDAACAVYNNTGQDYVVYHKFDFSISDSPTIDSFTVKVKARGSAIPAAKREYRVGLTKDSTNVYGTAKLYTTNNAGACSDAVTESQGGDLFGGASWSATEINARGFGVIIYDDDATADEFNIDAVWVTVWYTEAGVAAVEARRRHEIIGGN